MPNMKAIITGASGFVGSALIKHLLKNDFSILAVSLSFDDTRIPNDPRIKKIVLPLEKISELKNIVKAGEYDYFYHFAWAGSAGQQRSDENIQIKNAIWTVDSLRVAHALGCRKFISAGSIMEYEVYAAIYEQGNAPSLGYIYGVGKVLAHQLCKPIANSLGIDLVWAYITNAYGPGELSPRFINTTLRKIINKEQLEFTAATQNYDFIYIDDVARAFLLLGLHGKANKGYIIGSGQAKPLKEFILKMCETTNHDKAPIFGNIPFTGVNVPIETFSISEIGNDCGFEPSVSFSEGILHTMKWIKEQN